MLASCPGCLVAEDVRRWRKTCRVVVVVSFEVACAGEVEKRAQSYVAGPTFIQREFSSFTGLETRFSTASHIHGSKVQIGQICSRAYAYLSHATHPPHDLSLIHLLHRTPTSCT